MLFNDNKIQKQVSREVFERIMLQMHCAFSGLEIGLWLKFLRCIFSTIKNNLGLVSGGDAAGAIETEMFRANDPPGRVG